VKRTVLALLVLLAAPAWAEPPPGLLRVSPGLPRSLPLVIRSPEGQAALVQVMDAASGAEVLAAFVPGGAPLRILVPPGRFTLLISTGRDWDQGGFARDLQRRTVGPLTFAITGFDRKGGHIVTLGAGPEAEAAAFALCQHPGAFRPAGVPQPVGTKNTPLIPQDDPQPGAPPQPVIRTLACG